MSPSFLAVKAIGLSPVGEPAEKDGTCCFCGADYKRGDLIQLFEPSSGFMDGRSLRVRDGQPWICGSCAALTPKHVLQAVQSVIFTSEGAFPIGKGENRAWFLKSPPKPPFLVIFATSDSQHLVWKAPVTRDPDHWFVQLGPRTVIVRRLLALRAIDAIQKIGEVYLAQKRKLNNPFEGLDPWQSETTHGVIREQVREFCVANGLGAELAILEQLGRGELWALSPLFFRGKQATMPAPLSPPAKKAKASNDSEAE